MSSSIPFSVADDSLFTFTNDTQGIIDDNNLDEFFGVTDTVNGDNSSGDVSASWNFDISSASSVFVSIDIGAMGDFETSDTFVFKASIDGGPEQILFETVVDESGSQEYVLAGGTSNTLNDPLSIDGINLTNVLQTFTAEVDGTGSVLTLTFEANTNGGSPISRLKSIGRTDPC